MRSPCCTPGRRAAPTSEAAFKAQVDALGVGTTLLVDTYDITQGVANAVEVAGTELGAVRIDSGDLGVLARQVRDQLDGLGAHRDPHRGVGRSRRVRDRGAARRTRRHLRRRARRWSPARAPRPPAWSTSWSRSTACPSRNAAATRNPTVAASRRCAWPSRRAPSSRRSFIPYGRATVRTEPGRALTVDLVREGEPVGDLGIDAARRRVKDGLHSLPWDGLKLSKGEPAIPTRMIPPAPERRLGDATGETAEVTELLAKAVAALGGSERSGQIEMAEAVAQRIRHRRAPRGAGRHRDRQVAGVPGACDRAGRRHRRARGGVDRDHRPAAPARRPRPAAAGRLAGRRAASRDRSSRC